MRKLCEKPFYTCQSHDNTAAQVAQLPEIFTIFHDKKLYGRKSARDAEGFDIDSRTLTEKIACIFRGTVAEIDTCFGAFPRLNSTATATSIRRSAFISPSKLGLKPEKHNTKSHSDHEEVKKAHLATRSRVI